MALSALSSTSTSSSDVSNATAAMGSNSLGKDQFVKLLMAQLSNQDPTNPVDNQAFVAQLAQFATLEQLESANRSLDSLLIAQNSANQSTLVSLVGKDALLNSDQITMRSTAEKQSILGRLSHPADEIVATITDSQGKIVRTLQAGPSSGDIKLTWDGLDDQGNPLPPGEYHSQLSASKKEGNEVINVPVEQLYQDRITGISFREGHPELMVGTRRIQLSDLAEVVQPS